MRELDQVLDATWDASISLVELAGDAIGWNKPLLRAHEVLVAGNRLLRVLGDAHELYLRSQHFGSASGPGKMSRYIEDLLDRFGAGSTAEVAPPYDPRALYRALGRIPSVLPELPARLQVRAIPGHGMHEVIAPPATVTGVIDGIQEDVPSSVELR